MAQDTNQGQGQGGPNAGLPTRTIRGGTLTPGRPGRDGYPPTRNRVNNPFNPPTTIIEHTRRPT